MILVIGATGQLGTAVIRKLTAAGRDVRAFVRPTSAYKHLEGPHVEFAFGDLRDPTSVDAACKGADVVIATANAVAPRGNEKFGDVEGEGYRQLLAACARHGVRQFIFMSVPVTPSDDKVPTFRYKRIIEEQIRKSGVPFTVFRGSMFMDDWFALIGSSIPLRGAESATLKRPFWFSRMFMRGVGTLVENRGIALVPGDGTTRHAWVALDDVANFIVAAIGHPRAVNAVIEVGGPEILSWNEAVEIFGKVIGRRIRVLHTPAGVFRAQQIALGPFSPAAANLMGLNWSAGTDGTPFEMSKTAADFGVTLTSVETFLRDKSQLPAEA